MKQLIIIILVFGIINCLVAQNRLSDNKTFRKTFSTTEIKDLQLLFDFFNESICSITIAQNLNDCYQEFFSIMEKSVQTGNIQLNIPFEKQTEIYERFSDSTFYKIWTFGKIWNYPEAPQDTFRRVYFTPNGKYLDFLKRTGRRNKVIRNYYEIALTTGDISPTMIAGLLVNYRYFDIKDIRVKFIIAIHYLTLNDQFERKERINQ